MPNTLSDSDLEELVRAYAQGLGLDEAAVGAALHRLEADTVPDRSRAVEEACALLRSWWRHPSHQAAA